MSTSGIDHGKKINALLRKLKKPGEDACIEREPIEQLIYSILLWEAPQQKADAAMKRVLAGVVDFNELRVMRMEDVSAILGKTYPRCTERAERIKAALHEIYLREYEVSLDNCLGLSKREGRKYLETLEGMPPFAAARMTLLCLGGHAVPVDGRLLDRLIDGGVLEEETDIERATGILERHIKAEDGRDAHLKLLSWVEDTKSKASGRAAGSARAAAKKKTKKKARRSAAS